MFWVSSCSPLRYLCLCGWFFCTFSSPWHQGLFWVIVSSLSLTDCTAPVTHSSWTCTLEFAVLNNWSKLYVFYIQLEEEINPLHSVYQAVCIRKTFSMLEMFTAPQAEIIKRLQPSCVSMSNSMTVHKLLMFLYFFFWVSCGYLGVLWLKFIFWLLKKGSERPYLVCCDLVVILLLLHWGPLLKSPVRMCAGHCSLLPQQSHPQLSIHVIPLTFAYSFFCCFCFTYGPFH